LISRLTTNVLGNPSDPQPRQHKDGQGLASQFNLIGGLVFDKFKNLFIADSSGTIIAQANSSLYVRTIAGSDLVANYADGVGTAAAFNNMRQMVFDSIGKLFVTDQRNNAIRMISW